MEDRINKIIQLILIEAEEINNPDPVARIYNVSMKIQRILIDRIEKIREQEQCEKSAGGQG